MNRKGRTVHLVSVLETGDVNDGWWWRSGGGVWGVIDSGWDRWLPNFHRRKVRLGH